MKKREILPHDLISLEDQDFLKELGISGLPSGREFLLRQQEANAAALQRIEERAEGLRALSLDEKTLEILSEEKVRPIEELREDLRLFRDITKKPEDEEE